ncbi:MAG TPA: hypothetical protein VEH77_07880 [Roseiarcus sp.]|nr:hypothetical protein [Roseiarcus sp.]
MKLSARNQIAGTIKDVHKGATTAHVEIDVLTRSRVFTDEEAAELDAAGEPPRGADL